MPSFRKAKAILENHKDALDLVKDSVHRESLRSGHPFVAAWAAAIESAVQLENSSSRNTEVFSLTLTINPDKSFICIHNWERKTKISIMELLECFLIEKIFKRYLKRVCLYVCVCARSDN